MHIFVYCVFTYVCYAGILTTVEIHRARNETILQLLIAVRDLWRRPLTPQSVTLLTLPRAGYKLVEWRTSESEVYPARGRVGRVTDSGVRGLVFKSPGPILTSSTETCSLSIPLSGWKKISCGGVLDLAVEQPQLFRNQH